MKIKDIIVYLQSCNPDSELNVAIYDCGGFWGTFPVEFAESVEIDGVSYPQVEISIGCDAHKGLKFLTNNGHSTDLN